MRKSLLLSLALCAFIPATACDEPVHLRSAPVPVGEVAAGVNDVLEPVDLLSDCLAPTSPLQPPSPAKVVVDVPAIAGDDDQQVVIITLYTHAHEDSVACLRDTVAGWAGEP